MNGKLYEAVVVKNLEKQKDKKQPLSEIVVVLPPFVAKDEKHAERIAWAAAIDTEDIDLENDDLEVLVRPFL